jgi:hypothetical protein
MTQKKVKTDQHANLRAVLLTSFHFSNDVMWIKVKEGQNSERLTTRLIVCMLLYISLLKSNLARSRLMKYDDLLKTPHKFRAPPANVRVTLYGRAALN